ncbi:MAG: helix-turn-helix domain-containing protein [Bacteroidales bacterium]|jgi:excisionase family DNA binding protein
MEQFDDLILGFEQNFDKSVQKARTLEAFDKMKKVFEEMIECLNALKEDYLEPLMEEKDDILTVKQVAVEYGISTISLYKHIKAKEIPVIKIGNKIRIRRSAFEYYKDTSKFGF